MKNKLVENGGKENLKVPQPGFSDNDWVETEFGEEELDIATAIAEAHDDPC